MGRSHNVVGLNERSRTWLMDNCELDHFEIKKNGEIINEYDAPKRFDGLFDFHFGFDCELKKLPAYKLKDNETFVYEKLQAEPWSSGPVSYFHLVDKDGNSINTDLDWTEDEINNC